MHFAPGEGKNIVDKTNKQNKISDSLVLPSMRLETEVHTV